MFYKHNKLLRYCKFKEVIFKRRCFQARRDKNTSFVDEDVMDDFITQLTQRRCNDWNYTHKKFANKELLPKLNKDYKVPVNVNLKGADIEQVNGLLESALQNEDYETMVAIVNECIKWEKCPSLSNLMKVLSTLAQNGERNIIVKLQVLYEKAQPKVLNANADFHLYLAEAMWIKGNINKALNLFANVYKSHIFLRRRIKLILKYLILDVVTNRSEGVLINLIDFCEILVKEYEDYYPLGCVWQSCFLSEWYTDQCISMELLERNEGLCKAVINRIPYVVTIALRTHQTDVVHRLLEILLKYDLKLESSVVLTALFNYRCK